MTVVVPADATAVPALLRQSIALDGPVYFRMGRNPVPVIYEPAQEFTLGRAITLREGGDVTLIATGVMVSLALDAAAELARDGIQARVLDMHTIKPLDGEAVQAAAAETGAIVTAEDHSIIGGLGGAVAEWLAEHRPVPLARVGIPDIFGRSGDPAELFPMYGMAVRGHRRGGKAGDCTGETRRHVDKEADRVCSRNFWSHRSRYRRGARDRAGDCGGAGRAWRQVALVDIADPASFWRPEGSLALQADVSRPADVRRAVEATVAAFGGLDILVNNAGICPLSPFAEITEAEWDRVLAVNLKGAFLCCQAALPHLKQAGRRGRIINIASAGGQMGGRAGGRTLRGIQSRADRPDQIAGKAAGAGRGDRQLRVARDDLHRPDRCMVGRDAGPGAGADPAGPLRRAGRGRRRRLLPGKRRSGVHHRRDAGCERGLYLR